MLGASNHTDKEREINDYYATEPRALELLLEKEKFLLNSGAVILSHGNDLKIVGQIVKMATFLMKERSLNEEENVLDLIFEDKKLMIFFLGCRLKELLGLDNFIVTKKIFKPKKHSNQSKDQPNNSESAQSNLTLEVVKLRNPRKISFSEKHTDLRCFENKLKENPQIIYQFRYQLGSKNSENLVDFLVF